MIPFAVQKAVEITGGQFCGPEALLSDSFDSVSIDTRTMRSGALYVPVKGDVFDGHRFIPQAMEKGAKLTLSEVDTPHPHIRVQNRRSIPPIPTSAYKTASRPSKPWPTPIGANSTSPWWA